MYQEDLEASNLRQAQRNRDVVRSYWPVMNKLREAEAEAARLAGELERSMEAHRACKVSRGCGVEWGLGGG